MQEPSVYELFRKGTELLEQGDHHAAAVALGRARDLAPDKDSVREAYGRALVGAGRGGAGARRAGARRRRRSSGPWWSPRRPTTTRFSASPAPCSAGPATPRRAT